MERAMPNWVFNNLSITGNEEDIDKLVNQVNKSFDTFQDTFDKETGKFGTEIVTYSSPVFAFHNIYNHLDDGVPMDVYSKQPIRSELGVDNPNWWADTQKIASVDNSWYKWNIRNWGTKWDVAVADNEKYVDTSMEGPLLRGNDSLVIYHFNTAWGAPVPIILKLSEQYPELNFEFDYDEETGWGGRVTIRAGKIVEEFEYDSKCNECDTEFLGDGLAWCDDCDDSVCSECNYGASDDCAIHKVKAGV